jgi:hypothetical protein
LDAGLNKKPRQNAFFPAHGRASRPVCSILSGSFHTFPPEDGAAPGPATAAAKGRRDLSSGIRGHAKVFHPKAQFQEKPVDFSWSECPD